MQTFIKESFIIVPNMKRIWKTIISLWWYRILNEMCPNPYRYRMHTCNKHVCISMLHATMTTKVQNSILIDALHFNIQTNWNENHYSCYFFLDYWFSPYEFLLWFWLEALIPTQLNYLTDNLRSIYHKLWENGTGWSVYLKVFVGWRFQR